MASSITLPVKELRGDKWAEISALAPSTTFYIVGETVGQMKDLSFFGNHRVRQYKFKKNVHFMVPAGIELDISQVSPAEPPRRQQTRR